MVELGNVADLTNAMVELIDEAPHRRARLVSEARQVVEREYDESISADRLLDIYRELA